MVYCGACAWYWQVRECQCVGESLCYVAKRSVFREQANRVIGKMEVDAFTLEKGAMLLALAVFVWFAVTRMERPQKVSLFSAVIATSRPRPSILYQDQGYLNHHVLVNWDQLLRAWRFRLDNDFLQWLTCQSRCLHTQLIWELVSKSGSQNQGRFLVLLRLQCWISCLHYNLVAKHMWRADVELRIVVAVVRPSTVQCKWEFHWRCNNEASLHFTDIIQILQSYLL